MDWLFVEVVVSVCTSTICSSFHCSLLCVDDSRSKTGAEARAGPLQVAVDLGVVVRLLAWSFSTAPCGWIMMFRGAQLGVDQLSPPPAIGGPYAQMMKTHQHCGEAQCGDDFSPAYESRGSVATLNVIISSCSKLLPSVRFHLNLAGAGSTTFTFVSPCTSRRHGDQPAAPRHCSAQAIRGDTTIKERCLLRNIIIVGAPPLTTTPPTRRRRSSCSPFLMLLAGLLGEACRGSLLERRHRPAS